MPVAPNARAALAKSLRALRHDLGKSLSLQLRFAGDSASEAERAEALREDVCRTRRGPAGVVSAFDLFDGAWPWMVGLADVPDAPGVRVDLSPDPAAIGLQAAIEALRARRSDIEATTPRGPDLEALIAHAHAGTATCRALTQRYGDR